KRLIVQPAGDDEYFLGIRVSLAPERSRVSPGAKARQSSVLARGRINAERQFLGHPLEPSDWRPTSVILGGQRIPIRRQRLRHLAPRSKFPCDPTTPPKVQAYLPR